MIESRFEEFVRSLSEPADYYKGVSSDAQYFPENLVFYSRRSSAELFGKLPFVHYRFNLIFCLKGSFQIHIENYMLTIEEGESLLIFPFQNHHYVTDNESDILCFFIGFDMQERKNLEVLRNRVVSVTPFSVFCLDHMISASDDFKVNLLSAILLSHIENCAAPRTSGHTFRKVRVNAVVGLVQRYVYADLSRMVTTALIAKELGISESNLFKQFKRAIGISPGRYLREVKINYACSILESTDFSVTETAIHCGFDSVYSFSRTFKKVTGLSPSQFRKRKG